MLHLFCSRFVAGSLTQIHIGKMTLASKILLASIGAIYAIYADRYKQEDFRKQFPDDPQDLNLPVLKTYDFIVVGAGDAGCILARRLSDARFSVLLLETGGTPPPMQKVYGVAETLQNYPQVAYLYQTTRQKRAGLKTNGVLLSVAGKAMGGGTTINSGLYFRGSPELYNEWALLSGDSSWRYENLLPYFLRNEKYMGVFKQNGQHNLNGNFIPVSHIDYAPGRELWFEAGRELGYPVGDANGPAFEGFSPDETTTQFGRRMSTYTAYIEPVEGTSRFLTVHRYSTVSKVLINENKAAYGVLYTQHGIPRVAHASNEVILSAGAYLSPLILINSGIGPEDQLGAANVEPIRISPSGKNLQNHVLLNAEINVNDPSLTWTIDGNLTFKAFSDFIENGQGSLTTAVGIAGAFLKSSRARGSDKRETLGPATWPDLQLGYNYKAPDKNKVARKLGLIRPRSIGRITLNTSATGFDDDRLPILDYKYFEDESDLEVMLEGLEFCGTIAKTKAFQKVGARLFIPKIKQCLQKYKFESREYLKCYIMYDTDTYHHTSGTCRMGKRDDPRSVVDSKLRVLGVERLSVCDASIMPIVVNANIATPVGAIAEKMADMLVGQYKSKSKMEKRT